MDLFVQNHLSDDQWALIGCAAALVLSGTLMSLSYFLGQARQTSAARRLTRVGGELAPQRAAEHSGRKAA